MSTDRPHPALRRLRFAAVGLVALLVAGAVATRVLVAQAEAEHPQLGRLVDVGDVAQHVVEGGRGEAIVLVHGAFGAAQDFTSSIGLLNAGDLQSHG